MSPFLESRPILRNVAALIRRHLVLLALIAAPACLDNITVGDSTVRGTYTLRTVNGAALPFTRTVNGSKLELLDDQYSLFAGNTFAQEGHLRTTTAGQTTTTTTSSTGVYGSQGTSLSLVGNGTGTRVSTIEYANTMTIVEDGATYVYKK